MEFKEDRKPVRVQPRVVRLWLAPWEDSDGDLHMGGFIYAEVAGKRRWVLGEKTLDMESRTGPKLMSPLLPGKNEDVNETSDSKTKGKGKGDGSEKPNTRERGSRETAARPVGRGPAVGPRALRLCKKQPNSKWRLRFTGGREKVNTWSLRLTDLTSSQKMHSTRRSPDEKLFRKAQAYAARKFRRVSTRENLKSALVMAVFIALMIGKNAVAGTTGSEFQNIYNMVVDWTSGYLGKTIALGPSLPGWVSGSFVNP